MNPIQQRSPWFLTAGIAAVALYWTVVMFPTPAQLLLDHGQGYQLAGAAEILAGNHPFIAFKDIYGPLVHYASAAAQTFAGERIAGELILVGLSFAIGYVILFRLMMKCAVPTWLALVTTLVAIAAKPESWRYYMLLLPMVFFAAAWRYVERPSRRRLIVMAFTVTCAGLFRPDLGVFTYVSGVALIGTFWNDRKQVAWQLTGFSLCVLLCALPWLGWLAAHGKMTAYLVNSSLDAIQDAAGRARPAPWFDFSTSVYSEQNAKAYLFRLPAFMLVFATVMLVLRRAQVQGVLRSQLFCALTFVILSQLQGAHIVDWIHVRDTLPMRLFLFAWIAAGVAPGAVRGWHVAAIRRCVPQGVAALVGLSLMGAVVETPLPGRMTLKAVKEKLSVYTGSREELLTYVRKRRECPCARLYEYVRDHSAPDETVFAVIEAPQTNYFANRRLAGPQLAIFPGYFSSHEDQLQLIAQLRQGRTAFVIIDHVGMKEYRDLSLAKFAPEFYAFLQEEFVEVTKIDYCQVLTPRKRLAFPLVAAE